MPNVHIKCGGELHPHYITEIEVKRENKYRRKNRLPKIEYYFNKDNRMILLEDYNFHKCGKCGAIISIITMPSYDDMVKSGDIQKAL